MIQNHMYSPETTLQILNFSVFLSWEMQYHSLSGCSQWQQTGPPRQSSVHECEHPTLQSSVKVSASSISYLFMLVMFCFPWVSQNVTSSEAEKHLQAMTSFLEECFHFCPSWYFQVIDSTCDILNVFTTT